MKYKYSVAHRNLNTIWLSQQHILHDYYQKQVLQPAATPHPQLPHSSVLDSAGVPTLSYTEAWCRWACWWRRASRWSRHSGNGRSSPEAGTQSSPANSSRCAADTPTGSSGRVEEGRDGRGGRQAGRQAHEEAMEQSTRRDSSRRQEEWGEWEGQHGH